MNSRQLIHTITAVAIAISTGSLVLTGLPEGVQTIVISASGLIAFVLNTYMGFTTAGVVKTTPPTV